MKINSFIVYFLINGIYISPKRWNYNLNYLYFLISITYYMNIKGSTNIVGLIGHPVEHSFSPPMHNRAFESLNMDYVYVAALIGAVNTIDFKNMKGYNTDGIGAIKAIEEVSRIKNKKILIAGAGGASRAISFYLAKYGAESLTILNRNVDKAEYLARDIINSELINNIESDSISNINNHMSDSDILINTTPVGMYPNIDDEPIITSENIPEDSIVFDAVYNPNETGLIKETVKAGATPVYGIKMLLYQGAESFEIWTGKKAPVDVMEKALKETLNLK